MKYVKKSLLFTVLLGVLLTMVACGGNTFEDKSLRYKNVKAGKPLVIPQGMQVKQSDKFAIPGGIEGIDAENLEEIPAPFNIEQELEETKALLETQETEK